MSHKKNRSKKVLPIITDTPYVEKKQDKSRFVPQREKLEWKMNIRERSDLTERQKVILEAAEQKNCRAVMIDGVWGSSKSFLAILASLKLLNAGKVDQILYCRLPVPATQHGKIGFLAGSVEEKMAPYNAVLYEKLEEFLPKPEVDKLIKENRIECINAGFVQGRSFACKAIIVDECASIDWATLLLLISRCGEFTRIFFIGDTANQVYLSQYSGFRRFFETFDDDDSKKNGVFCFELKQNSDIVRSGFLRWVMDKISKTQPIIS